MLRTALSCFLISTVFAMDDSDHVSSNLVDGGSDGNSVISHPIRVIFLDETTSYYIRNLYQIKVNLTGQDGQEVTSFKFHYRQNKILQPIPCKEKDPVLRSDLFLSVLPVTATAYFLSEYINAKNICRDIKTINFDEWQPPKQIGQITRWDILRKTNDGILEILDEICFTPKSVKFTYIDANKGGEGD